MSNSDLLKYWDDTYKFIKEAKYVFLCLYMLACMRVLFVCMRPRVRVCVCVPLCVHVSLCVCMYTCTYAYVCMHMCM